MPKTDQPVSDRDSKGRLTYAALVQIFREGGTVVLGGQHVTKLEDLPTEAEYVRGDADAEAEALGRLVQAHQLLEAQIAALTPKKTPKPAGDGK